MSVSESFPSGETQVWRETRLRGQGCAGQHPTAIRLSEPCMKSLRGDFQPPPTPINYVSQQIQYKVSLPSWKMKFFMGMQDPTGQEIGLSPCPCHLGTVMQTLSS